MMQNRPTTAELAAAEYRKSSYSGGSGNECVELAVLNSWVAVRDSKNVDRPALVFPADSLAAFLSRVKVTSHA